MKLGYVALAIIGFPTLVFGDTLIATRTIRAQTVLTKNDVTILRNNSPNALTGIDDIIGLETRVTLYEGRPINSRDIGPAAIVERNQIVTLMYQRGGLSIAAEARSLGRAGIGEVVRIMNLASRQTVTGIVRHDGTVSVRSY
ncbi:MAG: flagellar basal body P-ring formation protein FlgA [Marinosulfonomonas sp.]|nr:flagellar basal body P-ring formation protein FlgA [Marinosulfonomonas sp.]